MITCGAFICFRWPDSLNERNNLNPSDFTLKTLIALAINTCKSLIDDPLRDKLLNCTKFLTIGVDSYKKKISLSNVSISQPHAEMVIVYEVKTGRYYYTGKSYPTVGQEKGLIRFPELESHFIDTESGKVLVLGCHDLNIFSPRGKVKTKQEWRRKVRENVYDLMYSYKPTLVLHHPHTTDSTRTWSQSINELINIFPFVTRFLSAGRCFNKDRVRSPINEILEKTKFGDSIDFIVRTW